MMKNLMTSNLNEVHHTKPQYLYNFNITVSDNIKTIVSFINRKLFVDNLYHSLLIFFPCGCVMWLSPAVLD